MHVVCKMTVILFKPQCVEVIDAIMEISFWKKNYHWLLQKLTKWQLSVQPVLKNSSKRQYPFQWLQYYGCSHIKPWIILSQWLQLVWRCLTSNNPINIRQDSQLSVEIILLLALKGGTASDMLSWIKECDKMKWQLCPIWWHSEISSFPSHRSIFNGLTHWGRVMHICVSRLDHHWFR